MQRSFVVFSASLLCSVFACGDEPTVAGSGGPGTSATTEAATDGASGDDADSVDGTAGTVDGTTGVVDDTTGEPEPEFDPYPARGITLTEVYADHGVSVPVVLDGEWVDGTSRNAALIGNRNTLFRAFWELEPDWVPREIEGRLTLLYLDGSEEVASRLFWVEGESQANDLDTNIHFIVPGELLVPGVRFSMELFETTEGYRDEPEPEQLFYPREPGYVGIEGVDMALKVVIVPIDHDIGDCPEPPAPTEDELQYMSEQLFMQNPVERVEMDLRDPVSYTSGLNSFGPLLTFVADLRAQDGADPGAYYYGIIRPCDGGPEDVGGQAITIPDFPTQSNGWTRTSVGRWYGSLGSTASTFVHEVGHTQGRRHVACNGTEGGPDPSYPYDAGDIGVWGFGAFDFSLHGPTSSKDYMTYCGNTWVSDWGWGRVVPFIQEITSWDSAGAPAVDDADERILVGLIDPTTGDEGWLVTPGKAEGLVVEGHERVEMRRADGSLTSVDATVSPMGDSGGYVVVAPLPKALTVDELSAITRLHGAQRLPVRSVLSQGRRVELRD